MLNQQEWDALRDRVNEARGGRQGYGPGYTPELAELFEQIVETTLQARKLGTVGIVAASKKMDGLLKDVNRLTNLRRYQKDWAVFVEMVMKAAAEREGK